MEVEIVGRSVEHGKKGSVQIWMDAGYTIFASEGPSSIQIERLARHLNKNKSGFYYFFKDREFFMECLMKEHLRRLNSMTIRIREIRLFDPEYVDFLLEHREEFFFQVQLTKNREEESFNSILEVFNQRISAAVLPVWSDYVEAPIELADRLWGMTRDALYCRATASNFNFGWLRGQVNEARQLVHVQNPQAIAV